MSRLECALSCWIEARTLGVLPDVVEAPDWMAEGLVFALAESPPVVGHLHTPLRVILDHSGWHEPWNVDTRLADRLERYAIRRSAIVTSPSLLLARDLGERRWLGRRRPRIVRLGVDADRWQGLPSAVTTAPLVLAVGRLEPRKAPDVLLAAAARLTDVKDVDVVFLGREHPHPRDFSRARLSDRASRAGAPIRFVEAVSREDLRSWYGAARVVAVPSRYDNFPFVPLEAMASGRAVVCTTATGTAELADGGHGLTVVPSEDAGALAEALRPFLVDPGLAARAGEQARETVRSCDLDRVAAEREECYLDAISHCGRRGRPSWLWRIGGRFLEPLAASPPEAGPRVETSDG
jgi:glycosyltransferase involved in cell wall biosynthesis